MFLVNSIARKLNISIRQRGKLKLKRQTSNSLRLSGWLYVLALIMSLVLVRATAASFRTHNQTAPLRSRGLAAAQSRLSQRTSAYNSTAKATHKNNTERSNVYERARIRQLKSNYQLEQQKKMHALVEAHTQQRNQLMQQQRMTRQRDSQNHSQHSNNSSTVAIQTNNNEWHASTSEAVAAVPALIATANTTNSNATLPTPQALTATQQPQLHQQQQPQLQQPQQPQHQQDINAKEYKNHLYERLPVPPQLQRSQSTMTTFSSGYVHDQLPRPPRLTASHTALAVRRQSVDAPAAYNKSMSVEAQPKPFQFPNDGPLPTQFRKQQDEHAALNNIQDILQQLQLSNSYTTTKQPPMPQMVVMPNGLHIAGSFKNLKKSGILNFFRNKRYNKHKPLQLSMPFHLPMPLPMQLQPAYHAPLYNVYGQPYQPRISMDHIYPFKPRSPHDVNMLAFQQQLAASSTKSKNKHKQHKQLFPQMLQQHSHNNQAFAVLDPGLHGYTQLYGLNATQAPKRIPFKVNLDIFPVLPPTKDYGKSAGYGYNELIASTRPYTSASMHNPFIVTPSPANVAFQQQHAFRPLKFPASAQPQASNNVPMVFPEEKPRFAPQQLRPTSAYMQHSGFMPIDCNYAASSEENPILLHLNVFPKQKSTMRTPLSHATNPFYANFQHFQRNALPDNTQNQETAMQSEFVPKFVNISSFPTATQQQNSIARSDSDSEYEDEPLLDVNGEPPVTDKSAEQPDVVTSPSTNPDFYDAPLPQYSNHRDGRSNSNFKLNDDVDQLAAEMQTASLFRFPVEDLIQFQVNDAM